MAKPSDAIVEGGIYVYENRIPVTALGHFYKVHKFVMDVPSYQPKVLVEALSGKDRGLWFVCSINNFLVRYRIATPEEAQEIGLEQVNA